MVLNKAAVAIITIISWEILMKVLLAIRAVMSLDLWSIYLPFKRVRLRYEITIYDLLFAHMLPKSLY